MRRGRIFATAYQQCYINLLCVLIATHFEVDRAKGFVLTFDMNVVH